MSGAVLLYLFWPLTLFLGGDPKFTALAVYMFSVKSATILAVATIVAGLVALIRDRKQKKSHWPGTLLAIFGVIAFAVFLSGSGILFSAMLILWNILGPACIVAWFVMRNRSGINRSRWRLVLVAGIMLTYIMPLPLALSLLL